MSCTRSQKAELLAAVEKYGNQRAAAEALGIGQSTFSRRLNGRTRRGDDTQAEAQAKVVTKPTPKAVKVKRPASQVGLDGFRSLFDPAKRGHDAVSRLIETELKTRGWMYDTEMRSLSGIDAAAWTNLRRDYNELLVEVRDPETRARRTVWCHPEIVEEARQVAKERVR